MQSYFIRFAKLNLNVDNKKKTSSKNRFFTKKIIITHKSMKCFSRYFKITLLSSVSVNKSSTSRFFLHDKDDFFLLKKRKRIFLSLVQLISKGCRFGNIRCNLLNFNNIWKGQISSYQYILRNFHYFNVTSKRFVFRTSCKYEQHNTYDV